MGYELHIEREESRPISAEEWLNVVAQDSELELDESSGEYFARFLGDCEYGFGEGWLDWFDGRIFSKYPDNAILGKMLEVSDLLGATVRGDDGKIYTEPDINSGTQPGYDHYQASSHDRLWQFLLSLFPTKNRDSLPFAVGDRVKDHTGEGTVLSIDRYAEHGLGVILVKYDDGRELSSAIVAHGLERVPSTK